MGWCCSEGRVSMETVFFKFSTFGALSVWEAMKEMETPKKMRSVFPSYCHKTTIGTLGEMDCNY